LKIWHIRTVVYNFNVADIKQITTQNTLVAQTLKNFYESKNLAESYHSLHSLILLEWKDILFYLKYRGGR